MLFIEWLKSSFENRGKASARKLTIFIFASLLVFTWIMDVFKDITVDKILLIIGGIIVIVGLGYLTGEQVTRILKRNCDEDNEEVDNDSDGKSDAPME